MIAVISYRSPSVIAADNTNASHINIDKHRTDDSYFSNLKTTIISTRAEHLENYLHHHEVLNVNDVSHVHIQRRSESAFESFSDEESSEHIVRFIAYKRMFHLLLRKDKDMFMFGIKARILHRNGTSIPFNVDEENYLTGYDINHPQQSKARIYMNNRLISGRITIKGETYFLERSDPHYPNETNIHMIVYRSADVKHGDWHRGLNATGHSFCGAIHANVYRPLENQAHAQNLGSNRKDDVFSLPRKKRNRPSQVHNTCLVEAVADRKFFEFYNSERANTVQSMLNHVGIADDVFSSTQFGDFPKLHLFVHKVTILAENIRGTSVNQKLHYFSQNDFSDSCIAHLFTREDFSGGTLGLAWVGSRDSNRAGGLCHSSSTQSLNTGLTTNINFGENVPFATSSLVTAHEIGHNWGSQHDDPTDPECMPPRSQGDAYLMFSNAVDGSEDSHFKFSICSVQQIVAVIEAKGTCFREMPLGICGNGRVDPGEECDAGGAEDPCCNSDCKLQRPDGSQTLCTHLNNICCDSNSCSFYADGTHQCYEPFDRDLQCRDKGFCYDGKCEAPLPPKPVDTPCGNGGRCQNKTEPEQRCMPFCNRFGARSCVCEGNRECHVCCEHNPDADCIDGNNCMCPFKDLGCVPAQEIVTEDNVDNIEACYADDPNNPSETRYSDNPFVETVCEVEDEPCLRVLHRLPGTSCSQGQCNREGRCEKSSTGIARFWSADSFTLDSLQLWARNNIVGAVMIVALLFWIPGVCLIKRYDHKQRAKNPSYGTRRSATTMRRKRHTGQAHGHRNRYSRKFAKARARAAQERGQHQEHNRSRVEENRRRQKQYEREGKSGRVHLGAQNHKQALNKKKMALDRRENLADNRVLTIVKGRTSNLPEESDSLSNPGSSSNAKRGVPRRDHDHLRAVMAVRQQRQDQNNQHRKQLPQPRMVDQQKQLQQRHQLPSTNPQGAQRIASPDNAQRQPQVRQPQQPSSKMHNTAGNISHNVQPQSRPNTAANYPVISQKIREPVKQNRTDAVVRSSSVVNKNMIQRRLPSVQAGVVQQRPTRRLDDKSAAEVRRHVVAEGLTRKDIVLG